ncbi:MAG: MBL fold metallo-hydrolase [Deltaproteobacteria bacterium]|nr:MBL fold metallo-hydrolase [Deltaproteobacteria bacterium]
MADLIIQFLDVGQGDGTFIQFPNGKTMLVDLGSTKNKRLTQNDIHGYFEKHQTVFRKSGRLDYLVLTHPDRDHYNMVESFLKFLPLGGEKPKVECLIYGGIEADYGGLIAKIRGYMGSSMNVIGMGGEIELNSLPYVLEKSNNDPLITVLAMNDSTDANDANANSVVLRIDCNKRSVILTGDATWETETVMCMRAFKKKWPLRADILKVAHHGSARTSSSPQWIRAVNPTYAFIIADRHGELSASNKSGFRLPQSVTLDALSANARDLEKNCNPHGIVAAFDSFDYLKYNDHFGEALKTPDVLPCWLHEKTTLGVFTTIVAIGKSEEEPDIGAQYEVRVAPNGYMTVCTTDPGAGPQSYATTPHQFWHSSMVEVANTPAARREEPQRSIEEGPTQYPDDAVLPTEEVPLRDAARTIEKLLGELPPSYRGDQNGMTFSHGKSILASVPFAASTPIKSSSEKQAFTGTCASWAAFGDFSKWLDLPESIELVGDVRCATPPPPAKPVQLAWADLRYTKPKTKVLKQAQDQKPTLLINVIQLGILTRQSATSGLSLTEYEMKGQLNFGAHSLEVTGTFYDRFAPLRLHGSFEKEATNIGPRTATSPPGPLSLSREGETEENNPLESQMIFPSASPYLDRERGPGGEVAVRGPMLVAEKENSAILSLVKSLGLGDVTVGNLLDLPGLKQISQQIFPTELTLQFTPGVSPFEIERCSISFGVDEWNIVPGHLAVHKPLLTLYVLYPESNFSTYSIHLRATLFLGPVVKIDIEANTDDGFNIRGSLQTGTKEKGGQKIFLADLLGMEEPQNLRDIQIRELAVEVATAGSVSIGAALHWDHADCCLKDLHGWFKAEAEAKSLKFSGSLSGTLEFGTIIVDLSAQYMADSGFDFTGTWKGSCRFSALLKGLGIENVVLPFDPIFASASVHLNPSEWQVELVLETRAGSQLGLLIKRQGERWDVLACLGIQDESIDDGTPPTEFAYELKLADIPVVRSLTEKFTPDVADATLRLSRPLLIYATPTPPSATEKISPLLDSVRVEPGLTLSLRSALGEQDRRIVMRTASRRSGRSLTTRANAASPDGATLEIQKTFGPLHLRRIGGRMAEGSKLGVFIDGSLSLAGLTMAFDGLEIAIPLGSPKTVTTSLRGLDIRFNSAGLIISGGLTKQDERKYEGQLRIKCGKLDAFASGSYSEFENETATDIRPRTSASSPGSLSLSGVRVKEPKLLDSPPPSPDRERGIGGLRSRPPRGPMSEAHEASGFTASISGFVVVNVPLGGDPAFFVTGFAGGLGYNSQLSIPTIDNVIDYPLVVAARDSRESHTSLAEAMKDYVTPTVDQNWLAAGVRFTTYQMAESFALVTVSFGQRFELALMGTTTLVLPPPVVGKPPSAVLARADLMLLGRLVPDDGIFSVEARLSRNSWVLAESARLTGGFAFYLWFGSNPHAGDFVITLGGYNPYFERPSHYPAVPYLGLDWQVTNELKIRGQLYFAITPSVIMAGGALSAVYESGNIRAWFDVEAHFLIRYKPFHYGIEAGANVGVSALVDLWITSFRIEVHVGVKVHLWGPPFGGTLEVDLSVISFTIHFGTAKAEATLPDWQEFRRTFLPPANAAEREGSLPGVDVLSPIPTDSLIIFEALSGLVQKVSEQDWIVEPGRLRFRISTKVPSTHLIPPDGVERVCGKTKFGIGVMKIAPGDVEVRLNVTISEQAPTENGSATEWVVSEVLGAVPKGIWLSSSATMDPEGMIAGVATGLDVAPKPEKEPNGTDVIPLSALAVASERERARTWKEAWLPGKNKDFRDGIEAMKSRRQNVKSHFHYNESIAMLRRVFGGPDDSGSGQSSPVLKMSFADTFFAAPKVAGVGGK